MPGRVEIRDGREFKVTVLSDAAPPKNRSAKSRYHLKGFNGKDARGPDGLRCWDCGRYLRGKGCASKMLADGRWWAKCGRCLTKKKR